MHTTHATYLIRLGELTLKGANQRVFEQALKRNLLTLLRQGGAPRALPSAFHVETTNGRFFVHCPDEPAFHAVVEDALGRLFGIAGWARARIAGKTIENVVSACVDEARACFDDGARTFKIEARRTDKRFPLDSYGICCAAGDAVCQEIPGFLVDVHHPDCVVEVEIRERGYVYSRFRPALRTGLFPLTGLPGRGQGRRGLPVGTAGRGLLLLSGGIDSPVAGYCMAGRGMRLDAVYFHAYPYTSDAARDKVITLANILGSYSMGVNLGIVGFTSVEQRITAGAPEPWRTIMLRMAMMACAERIAHSRGDTCLITGESLAQVASQTVENIACTESRVHLPVFRPLIGLDKEWIIRTAESIGTYATSILPYPDCCVLFSPPHPVLHGDVATATAFYDALGLEDGIAQAAGHAEWH